MMPFWVEKVGAPRTLAIEFPFAYTLGLPKHPEQQRRVLLEALSVLESAAEPGTIVDSKEVWPLKYAAFYANVGRRSLRGIHDIAVWYVSCTKMSDGKFFGFLELVLQEEMC